MLKKVTIENFRSFGNRTEIPLTNFNIVIGRNNSGKSNFFEVLQLMSSIMQEGVIDFQDADGFSEIVFNRDINNEILIILEYEYDDLVYQYEAAIRKGPVIEEILSSEDQSIIKGKTSRGEYWNPESERFDEFEIGDSTSLIAQQRDNIHESVGYLRKMLLDFMIYDLNRENMRENPDAVQSNRLTSRGSNFVSTLATLYTSQPSDFEKFLKIFQAGIREIDDLRTPIGDYVFDVVAEETDIDAEIVLDEMSDGMLKLMGHLLAVFAPESPKIAAFEEPGNHLHPYLIETLVDVFDTVNNQVLATTHSPYMLNFIDVEDLLIFDKIQGKTIVKKVNNISEIEDMRAKGEMSLGEIWTTGVIGGVPE